jgi:transcriptional regulator with XRE-family HTH domain
MKTFGKTISDKRKELGISQKDLAFQIKKEDGTQISAQYLNDIEHDRRNPPSEDMLFQLADALGFDRDFLCLVAGTIPKDLQEKAQNASQDDISRVIKAFRRSLK